MAVSGGPLRVIGDLGEEGVGGSERHRQRSLAGQHRLLLQHRPPVRTKPKKQLKNRFR